jgi:hypothetical protein
LPDYVAFGYFLLVMCNSIYKSQRGEERKETPEPFASLLLCGFALKIKPQFVVTSGVNKMREIQQHEQIFCQRR